MKDFFYRCLMFLAKRFGTWIFLPIAWHVATGYFLFSPRRVAVSVRFYRRLFPERSRWYPLWCAWRQYHHFVHVFLDRFLLEEGEDLQRPFMRDGSISTRRPRADGGGSSSCPTWAVGRSPLNSSGNTDGTIPA